MAKVPDDKIDFDELEFDDELSNLDFETDINPPEGGRTVAKETASTFGAEIRKQLTEPSYIRKLVGLTMPKGYSQAFNAYDATMDTLDDIYKENADDLKPYLARAEKMVSKSKSPLRKLIPNGLREKMRAASATEHIEAEGPSELDNNLGMVDELFKSTVSQNEEQNIRESRKELKDDKRFRLNLRANAQVGAGISRLVNYQDKILINYHRKSLEIAYRQYDVQSKLLQTTVSGTKSAIELMEDIRKNTSLPDYVKLKGTEALKERLRTRLADATISGLTQYRADYFRRLSSTASGAVRGLLMMGNQFSGMANSGMNKSQLAGMMLGGEAAAALAPRLQGLLEHGADLAAPVVAKIPGLTSTGDRLRSFLADPQGAINRFRMSDDEDVGIKGLVKGMLKDSLAEFTPKDRIDGVDIEALGDSALFDNFFYSTVTKEIPQYLESMDKGIRSLVAGKEVEGQAFSHYTGGMVSRSTLDQQHLRLGVMRGQGNLFRNEVSDLMGELGADVLSDQARNALGRRLLIDMQKGQGFDPADYVQPDSWPGVSEEDADALVDMFSEHFNLGTMGDKTNIAMDRLADFKEAFKDSSERLPAALERAQVLSERIMGRDVLRRLGITEFDGVQDDQVNQQNWTDIALGKDPIVATTPIDMEDSRGYAGMSLLDTANRVRIEAKRKLAEQAETERLERERLAAEGAFDEIDTLTKGFGPVREVKAGFIPQETVQSVQAPVNVSMPDLVTTQDIGTHERLDRLTALYRASQRVSEGGSEEDTDKRTEDALGKGWFDSEKLMARKDAVVTRVSTEAMALRAKAEKWYRESPRIQKLVKEIETAKGKITDPDVRARVIAKIYERTGTMDDIAEKYYDFVDNAMEFGSHMYDQARSGVQDAWGRRGEAKDYLNERYQSGKDYLNDRYQSGKETVTGWMTERADRFANGEISDYGTHERIDLTNELLAHLVEHGVSTGSDLSEEDIIRKKGLVGRVAGRVGSTLFGGAKRGLSATGKGLWKYLRTSYSLTGKGLMMGAKLGKDAAVAGVSTLIGDKTYGVRDVLLANDPKPRLYATGIRAGRYLDVNTEKVISGLKDITGPVRDIHTGNIVISQEEFDSGNLIDGKGDSLLGYIGRGTLSAGKAFGKAYLGYVKGTYGLMGGVAKMAYNAVKDQLTQFDAYFPGETEPRMNSRKMAQGFYRKGDGTIIESLDQIDGPVYDIDGNEIISQEDIDKYGSLYARNGSMLFTFGRGMISTGKFLGNLGLGYLKASYKVLGGIAKGGWKLAKGMVNKVLGIRASNLAGEYTEGVLIDQLMVQAQILEELRKRGKGDGLDDLEDGDGDGIRDNSWADVLKRRRNRRKRGPNADVVEAVEALGDRIDGSIDDLAESNSESMEGSKGGMISGLMDKLKGLGAKGLGGLGLGGLAEGLTSGGGNAAKGKPGLLGKIGRGVGKLLGGTGKGLWAVTKFAAKRIALPALIGAVKVGGAALSALGGLVSLPAVLIGAAIGGVAYLGWRYYQNLQFEKAPLFYLRMTQYGVSPRDEDFVDPILQLETLMASTVTGLGRETLDFDSRKVDMKKIYQIFGLLPKDVPTEQITEDDIRGIDPERNKRLMSWLAYRFKPTYLKHLSALYSIAKTKDLSKVDEHIVYREDYTKFLNIVKVRMTEVYDNTEELTPFDDDLDYDADDVYDRYEDCDELAEDRKPKPKSAKSSSEVAESDSKTTPVGMDRSKKKTAPKAPQSVSEGMSKGTKRPTKDLDAKPLTLPKASKVTVKDGVKTTVTNATLIWSNHQQLPGESDNEYAVRKQAHRHWMDGLKSGTPVTDPVMLEYALQARMEAIVQGKPMSIDKAFDVSKVKANVRRSQKAMEQEIVQGAVNEPDLNESEALLPAPDLPSRMVENAVNRRTEEMIVTQSHSNELMESMVKHLSDINAGVGKMVEAIDAIPHRMIASMPTNVYEGQYSEVDNLDGQKLMEQLNPKEPFEKPRRRPGVSTRRPYAQP